MRILFLDQSGCLGGAEFCLIDTVRPYVTDSLVCLFEDGPLRHRLTQQTGISVRILPFPQLLASRQSGLRVGVSCLRTLLPLARQVAELSSPYNLIYANTQKALVVGALASQLSGVPLVYHLHDIVCDRHFSRFNQRLIITVANRAATCIIANSQATARAFIQAGGDAQRVQVVYNGFSPQKYSDTSSLPSTGFTANQFLIGNFSRIASWKGQHVLIDALTYCPKEVVAIVVGGALFGEDAYDKRLKEQIQRLNLEERVRLVGFQDNVASWMSSCNLIAHTSTAPEPFGRVIAEAMLCQVPVVATQAGGPAELIHHQKTGWLIEPNQPHKLAEVIRYCQDNPTIAQSVARQGASAAIHQLQLDKIQLQLAEILRQVVGLSLPLKMEEVHASF